MDTRKYEERYGLPSGILDRLIQAESGGNPYAVSPKGALGIAQFMPATAKELGIDPFDKNQAVEGAARYLSQLHKQTGSIRDALIAYNWGPGNVAKHGSAKAPAESHSYADKIMAGIDENSTRTHGEGKEITADDVLSRLGIGVEQAGEKQSQPAAEVQKPAKATPDAKKVTAPPTGGAMPPDSIKPDSKGKMIAESIMDSPGYAMLRGGVQGLLGAPGDIESLLTSAVKKLPFTESVPDETILPTSKDVGNAMSKIGLRENKDYPITSAVGQFAGGMLLPMKGMSEVPGVFGKVFGGSPQTPFVADAVQEAVKKGYKIAPSEALGVRQSVIDATNFAKTAAGQANEGLFRKDLLKAIGVNMDMPITPDVLKAAQQEIPKRFMSAVKDVAPKASNYKFKIDPGVANSIKGMVSGKAQQIVDDAGGITLRNSLERAAETGYITPRQWVDSMSTIKSAIRSAKTPGERDALQTLASGMESVLASQPDKIKDAYKTFNKEWHSLATITSAVSKDPVFLQTGKVNPRDVLHALESGAKTTSSEINVLSAPSGIGRDAIVADTLNLVGKPRTVRHSNSSSLAHLESLMAGHPTFGAKHTLLSRLNEMTAGAALRRYYQSPKGQAALMGKNRMTDAEINALKALVQANNLYENSSD